ncbi:hypothetical protein AU192_17690 [Mycobacterium lehmannii]|uniref:Uncharacterized protein n=1 Tax=Mycobacterium lehmannii TaxID=2048550 RepID=A0A101A121_9MYCO|nr:hypothetical protein AU192_17690 [Mycobacterium lehmannii]
MDNFERQLDAAAAAGELDEPEKLLEVLELPESDDFFSDDEVFSDEELDSEEPDPLLEPFDELLADSRLSVR